MQYGQFSNTAVSLSRGRERGSFSVQEPACLHTSNLAPKTWRVPGEAQEKLVSEICEGISSSHRVINSSATGKASGAKSESSSASPLLSGLLPTPPPTLDVGLPTSVKITLPLRLLTQVVLNRGKLTFETSHDRGYT